MYAFLPRFAGNENPCAALIIEKILFSEFINILLQGKYS